MDDWIINKNFSSPDRHPPYHFNTLFISIERLINQRDTIKNCANIKLGWERDFISFSSRYSADSDSEFFYEYTSLRYDLSLRHDLPLKYDLSLRHGLSSRNDLPIVFLNRPSIQLNIYTTRNYVNTELGWGWGFMIFSFTLLSRFKFGAFLRIYNLLTALP